MTTATKPEPPHHRNLTCVKQYGCQRLECRARAADYARTRYRKVAYGTWEPLVAAQPVRDHITALREAGASTPSIAKAAGVSTATLGRAMYGWNGARPDAKMRRESAAALLGVRIEDCIVPDGALVDATGTRRRIQALVAMGWSFTALSPEIGIHSRPLGDMARTKWVTAGNARKVAAAYKRLVRTTPEQCGVHSQARALARRVAHREGWVLPGAWDDIDDPTAEPETDAPYQPPSANGRDSMRIAEIRHLLSLGESTASIARQMGGNEKYIRDLISQRGLGRAA